MIGDSCSARSGRGVDIRTAKFRFLTDDCGRGPDGRRTVSEIFAFFRATGDGADEDDVLLTHELEVPIGSPIDLLAQVVRDDPSGAVARVGKRLRRLVARCDCAGYDECPALSAFSLLTAMELAHARRSPA